MARTATRADAKLEAQIEKYRPRAKADEPASGGTLWHLNMHDLLGRAREAQLARDNQGVITKLTAWEVMAEAQRAGTVFRA